MLVEDVERIPKCCGWAAIHILGFVVGSVSVGLALVVLFYQSQWFSSTQNRSGH